MWQANRAKLSSARVWESIRLRLRKDNAAVLSSAELDAILAEIMTLSMPPVRMRTDEVGAMLMALAEALPPRSELLVSEFTSVVRHCCKDKLTLTSDQLQVLIPFFLAALSHCPSWYAEQILTTLSIILADNAASAAPLHDTIYAAATPHLDPSSADVGARYAATTCMAHLVAVTEAPPPYFASLWKHTMDNFQQQTRQLHSDAPRVVWTTNRTHYKSCLASLQCLVRLVELDTSSSGTPAPPGRVVEPHMPKVLDSLRLLLGCGLTLSAAAVVGRVPLSDSDSDSSKHSQSHRGIGLAAKLRLEVVRAFEVVLQSFPHLIAPTLALYLPTTTSPCLVLYNHQPSVLTVAVVDPYDQVRLKVLHWLELLLPVVNAKATLSQNFKNASSMAFTTTGGALVRMIHQVHLVVLHTLQYEHETAVLVQAMKTLTTLVSLCPYPNMLQASSTPATLSLDAILQALAHYLHNALFAPDHMVRVSALACLAALLSTPEPVSSVLTWLSQPTPPVESPLYHFNSTPLLRVRSRRFIEDMLSPAKSSSSTHAAHHSSSGGRIGTSPREPASTSMLHRLDAMSLLSKTAKNYATVLSAHWPRLSAFLLTAFRDMDQNVRLQAVKILENYVKGGNHTSHHLAFMATHVIRAFQDPSHHVRASVCACFTLLRPDEWTAFADNPAFMEYFLATPRDASPVVRAAGFRLLGAMALVPVFKTRDFIGAIVRMGMDAATDSTLNVRVRVVWAIGNACTTPGPDVPDSPDSPWLLRLLPPDSIDQVLRCMLHLVDDNDKVASSVVRTLGLLTRWIVSAQYLEASDHSTPFTGDLETLANTALLTDAMTVLAKKVVDGAPKVRWNACHALAKVFHCPVLPLASAPWTPAVFNALTAAIAQQDNFKVRISAAMALRISCARASYGVFFHGIVQTILDALDAAVDLTDISEYKYKAQLELQLSFTLVHLVALVQSEADQVALGSMLCRKYKDFIYDWLYHQQHKMYAAIFGEEAVDCAEDNVAEGHEVNPVSCAQVVDACDVLRRVIQQHCPHTASCLAQIAEVKLIFEMDMLDAIGFEF
ncbi:hypothetical protein H310_11197 [Aphanomyces invadans]|uniref:DUF4042 domain-containing protein n=1 Tax=Aphanomyces invadans TaxID=157072 RepID=A0A024TPL7_9STRA|nr:hypothetical protein H310_11197 [Aphanomyces invadans]ETV95297.1 hypothetical protein H310_11197 [Aphanomyces invadans]|eukprot:XP_008875998.1 hypothetical protein H310_11197 [Aphanomyces invadans]